MPDPSLAVEVTDLHKHYGGPAALRGVSLRVPGGTVCGLLGPNGAGKTTLVRILATLLKPDRGQAWVAGYHVVSQAAAVRQRLGLTGQYAALDEVLTGRDNLRLLGRLSHLPARSANDRAEALLAQFELLAAAGRPVKTYSGGMRRRLDLAASLIAAPPVLILDEPTTGLDPHSRAAIWAALRALVQQGATLLLTTQYLEEADQLADQIVILDQGQVIAAGPPAALKQRVGAAWIEIELPTAEQWSAAHAALNRPVGPFGPPRLSLPAPEGTRSLLEAARRLEAAGLGLSAIALRQPTLDDVFRQLTGPGAEPSPEVA
jgi:daunorubicin resistance ABC transporter ATP-binding subunit